MSSCIKKTEGLQTSPYIEYSCQLLQEVAEYETDLILVACARLQSIIESVNRNLANRPSSSDGQRAPLWMHATSVRTELQNVLNSLPSNLQSHRQYKFPPFISSTLRCGSRSHQAYDAIPLLKMKSFYSCHTS
jgi:hypothetical protein